MTAALWTFTVATGMVIYVHVVFPLALLIAARLRPRPFRADGPPVSVTIVLAAHGEADVISDRLTNLTNLDYPQDLMQIVLACDGGDDGTFAEAAKHESEQVEVLNLPRVGKAGAMNAALARARHEIIAFTDANTVWDAQALRKLVAPFADPSVGGTAGDQRYLGAGHTDPVAGNEATYWDLDRSLKKAQSTLGSVTSATGAIYAVRRELVEMIPAGVTDDFFVSTGVILRGQRLVFVPDALAFETVAPSREKEFARKTRIMTRGLRAVQSRSRLLNPVRHGTYAFQLLTHKVLRRLLFIPIALLAISALIGIRAHPLLTGAGLAQALFYLLALIGLALPRTGGGRAARALRVPAYFCLVYGAAAVATLRILRGQSVERWDHQRLEVTEAHDKSDGLRDSARG